MKPKDLPFTIKNFDARAPSFHDGVLTIPSFYDSHNKEDFKEELEMLFSKKSLHVEICSGNGEWIIDRAQKNPDVFYVAIEKKFMRVRKIWSKMKNKGLDNLMIVSGMGEDFFTHYLLPHSIDEIFINFPDPWPKKRHAKHRIVKESFIPLVLGALKEDGQITITTDSDDYSKEIISVFGKSKDFENSFPMQGFEILNEEYGGSYFRRLWTGLGRVNKLMTFKKTKLCASQKT